MNDNVAIVVSSCDFFQDCWEPFIYSMQKYWKDCPFHVHIVSNENEIKTPEGFSFIRVGRDMLFASNLKTALRKIDADYIIYLQEDYWLDKMVDTSAIIQHLKYCAEHDVDYLRLTFPYLSGDDVDHYYRQNTLSQRYSLCLQAAIWKRSKLMSLLRDGDSGWDFEYKIQQFAIDSHISVYALGLKSEYATLGINYVRGTAVRKGLWTIEGYKFLQENGFKNLLGKRGREGKFFGTIIDNQGPMRPIYLAIVKAMMKLKLNF